MIFFMNITIFIVPTCFPSRGWHVTKMQSRLASVLN